MSFSALFKSQRQKKIETAAAQMYQALLRGAKIEVPQTLSTDDDTVASVLHLQKKHPNVVTTMLQSRGIVLMLAKNAQGDGFNVLKKHGYFPDAKLEPVAFLDEHAAFISRRGEDADLDGGKKWAAERQSEQAVVVGEASPEVKS